MKNDQFQLTISKKWTQPFFDILGIVFLLCLQLFVVATVYKVPQTLAQKGITSPADYFKKQKLEKTYNDIIADEKKNDYASLYAYITPSEKASLSKEKFIASYTSDDPQYDMQFRINDVRIKNNVGIVDRTFSFCPTKNCSEKERVTFTNKKQFFYINDGWYMNNDNILYCDRTEPYVMDDEFERAYSLILQRLGQNNDKDINELGTNYSQIKNCINIQYAPSDKQLDGAEGIFNFSEKSTNEKLQIYVSPRYHAKDDLLTAILLSHELSHAYKFAEGGINDMTCYQNEARAYFSEMQFIYTLNDEEVASLDDRYMHHSSDELVGTINVISDLHAAKGDNLAEKALNYVQNDPFYQKECGEVGHN